MEPSDPTRKYLEEFEMAVYCFPDPEDAEQRVMIRTIGFAENVIRDIKYVEPDYVKLANIRREGKANLEAKPGLSSQFFTSCLHNHIGFPAFGRR